MTSAADSGQPSGPPSIYKGVDYPTEALTAAPDARRQVSALYQAHALAPVKLAALARLLKEGDAR